MGEPAVSWMLIRWMHDYHEPDEEDVVCWIPRGEPGVPPRCLCGYPFNAGTPRDAERIVCEGPMRHVWRSTMAELEQRIRLKLGEGPADAAMAGAIAGKLGESGRTASGSPAGSSTGPERENDAERPDSNNSGRPDVEVITDGGATLEIRTLPACTTCKTIGHLAADCPNEGGERGKA